MAAFFQPVPNRGFCARTLNESWNIKNSNRNFKKTAFIVYDINPFKNTY